MAVIKIHESSSTEISAAKKRRKTPMVATKSSDSVIADSGKIEHSRASSSSSSYSSGDNDKSPLLTQL